MPVKKVGKDCYQWGESGKKYCGPGAKEKATKQGIAIKISQENAKQEKKSKQILYLYIDNLKLVCYN